MRKMDQDTEKEARTDICQNCEHYCAHYILDRDIEQFVEIDYGHCMYPRNKIRMKQDTCAHFTEKK